MLTPISSKTTFIAYVSETKPSKLMDDDKNFTTVFHERGLGIKEYFLVVGRVVLENNVYTKFVFS